MITEYPQDNTTNFENSMDKLEDAVHLSPIAKTSISSNHEIMTVSDYMVAFSGRTQNYCVGLVDIVNSTKITAGLGTNSAKYYEIFLNSMAKILSRFGGFVVKNIGDSLLFYFPESSKSNRKFGFMCCLECCLGMVESHEKICSKMHEEHLPCVDYRISADYGSVMLMNVNSNNIDMIGPPVNMCSKINHSAPINDVIIGGDLHEMVKSFNDYHFKNHKSFSLGFKLDYPLYGVSRK